MSAYSVIDDVTNTLLEVLRTNMKELILPDHILSLSPADVESAEPPYLSLFLYRISEDEHMKNMNMPTSDIETVDYPPLSLKLFYLLSTYARDSQTEHRLMGRAMQILYDNSIVSGTMLKGGLAGTLEEMFITIDPLSIDDLNKLWSLFGSKPYKTSVGYRVLPILIDSTRKRKAERIIEKSLNVGLKE
jgi:hypothetical protein